MFVGHYGIAELLLNINKTIPTLPVAVGVAWPDFVWPVLIFLKKEKIEIDQKSPLQKNLNFVSYPHSHSLVRTSLITLFPAVIVALLYGRWIVGVYFFLAALSHWLIDSLMHFGLPLLGFGKDKKVGLGLWRFPRFSFFFEYAFFTACTLLFAPQHIWLPLLVGGFGLHMLNANSFFGFTKTNPTKTPNAYAGLVLFAYTLATTLFVIIWPGA